MKTKERANQIAVILVALILCISMPLTSGLAADWPMWRNDASNVGATGETINLPLIERWHSSAPDVEENGAVVADGIAYLSTEDGLLYAFEVSTGFEVAGFPVSTGPNYGTPAVDLINGNVYVLATSTLFAFNLDGTPAWTAAVGSVGANYFIGPIFDEGYVYCKAGGMLRKYDAAGAPQWASPAGGSNTQPSIMGDYVYSNAEGGQIHKFDKLTGTEVIGGGFPISTGASQSGLTTVNGKIFHKSDLLYAYNADDGTLLWSQPAGGYGTYYGSPGVSGGVVYVYGYDDARMYAFDENTGATMPGFPSVSLNTPGIEGRNWGSPAIAGDKVFIGAGTSQELKVLGAAGSAQAGEVLDQYLTFSTDPQGFDLCSPVISDGWVFAMLDGGGLYAFWGGGGPPPAGSLVINDDEPCTESRDVILNIDDDDNPNVVEMRISEDPFFEDALWEPYSSPTAWTLSPGYGTKTVYAQLRDTSGRESNVFTDQIDYLENCGGEEDISLSPLHDVNLVGTDHTVTARVEDDLGNPIPDREVNFEIIAGPHTGLVGTEITDANGEAFFTYTGTAVGTDTIVAMMLDSLGDEVYSNEVTKEWTEEPQECIQVTVYREWCSSNTVPRGGTLSYVITAKNVCDTTQCFDAWTNITLPNMTIYPWDGVLLAFPNLCFNPGRIGIHRDSIDIPLDAPLGNYEYNLFAGAYPDVMEEAHLMFTVVEAQQ